MSVVLDIDYKDRHRQRPHVDLKTARSDHAALFCSKEKPPLGDQLSELQPRSERGAGVGAAGQPGGKRWTLTGGEAFSDNLLYQFRNRFAR